MRDRSLGALLIPLLAMLTITLPVLGRSARTTAATQGLATSPSTAVPGSESGPAQASTPRTAGASALLRAFGEGQVRASRRIVATVPDPIDAANVAYTFDRYVDAIQRAMEAANYTLDRFDLHGETVMPPHRLWRSPKDSRTPRPPRPVLWASRISPLVALREAERRGSDLTPSWVSRL